MMRSAASLRPIDIRLALGFVTLTLLAWLADALLHASLLTGTEFPDSLIVGGPIVLWMRGVILAALLIGWVVPRSSSIVGVKLSVGGVSRGLCSIAPSRA